MGETFEVRLPDNPTTGYRWRLAEWDHGVLEAVRDAFTAPTAPQLGAGGEHVWEIATRASGQSPLVFALGRGWESASPARTFSLKVSVG